MYPFFWLTDTLLDFYKWVVIAWAVVSTLTSFGILDARNQLVWHIGDFLARVTEPALRPIRGVLPNLGAVDVSPLILIVLLQFAQMLLREFYASMP